MKNKLSILLGLFLLSNLSYSQLNKIVDFNTSSKGLNPKSVLKASGDFLFGTTERGGENNYGVIFRTTKTGSEYTVIHSFDSIHGASPIDNIYIKNNYIFGATYKGGTNDCGTIYKVKNDGSEFEVVFNNPINNEISNFIIVDSVLYGSCNRYVPSKIIRVSINGTGYKVLGSYSDNLNGIRHVLNFERDSFIYGTAWGGLTTNGVIFKIKLDGSNYSKLMDFDRYKMGSYPSDLFILDDKIYGIANQGGTNNEGTIFQLDFNGENDTVIFNGKMPNYGYIKNVIPYKTDLFCTTDQGSLFRINNHGQELKLIAKDKFPFDSIFYNTSIIDSSLYSFVYSPSSSFNVFLIKYEIKRLAISIDSLSVEASANSNGKFNIFSNTNWLLSSNQSWLTANNTNGSNDSLITLTTTANPTTAPRKAIVTVSSVGVGDKTIKITQIGADPVLTVSTKTLIIAKAANSTNSFDINSTTSWTVACDQSWLTVSKTNGIGNATIKLTAKQTSTPRTATITVSGLNVATQTIIVTQDDITSVIRNMDEQYFEIYPNPTGSILYFSIKAEEVTISIFDLNGKMVLNKQVNDNQINISDLRNGVYIIKIKGEKGILIKKFVFLKEQ